MTPAVLAFLQRFSARLLNVGLFVTSGNTDARKVVPSMERVLGHAAKAFIGFSAAELADQTTFDAKIAEFLGALDRSAVIRSGNFGAARLA